MVDVATYHRLHVPKHMDPQPFRGPSRFDPWPAEYKREDKLDDQMIILLPPTVLGFDIQEKEWSNYQLPTHKFDSSTNST